jgi:hypothetical protein
VDAFLSAAQESSFQVLESLHDHAYGSVGLVVTDVSVVHPATNSFFQQAVDTAGAAASS